MESAADVGNDHRDPQSVRGKLYRLNRVVIGNTLTFVWCAMLAWAIYFYAIYLLCTRPHDSRLVQIYLLLMGTLMLPWGLVLLITCIMREIKVNQAPTPSPPGETKDG